MKNELCSATNISGAGNWGMHYFQLGGWLDPFDPAVGPKFFGGVRLKRSHGRGGPVMPGEAGDSSGAELDFYHEPVMLEEAAQYLQPTRGKRFLDGTLGGGGHALRILREGSEVIGLDQDPEAMEVAEARLAGFASHCHLIRANFADYPDILETVGIGKLDGILLDLGVSSRQLEDASRGFSFSGEGPLDMRMNPDSELTAEYLVNHSDVSELARIFIEYGEEPKAGRIAKAIGRERAEHPITSARQLADLVEKVVPRRGKRRHPATRVFQALRIAVNDELHALELALQGAVSWLNPGGRLVVISFHSLEDRIVKRFMRRHSQMWLDRPEWPEPKPNPDYHFSLVVKRALRPSPEEVARNPRARSAKMRVAERLNHA